MAHTPRSCGCVIGWLKKDEHYGIPYFGIDYCPLHAAAPQLLEALEEVEFIGVEYPDGEYSETYYECPSCRHPEEHEHYDDCKLYLAIRAAKGE